MFAARVGVGMGEATLSPAAYSLIADYFPPNRRATALSVYSMGIYIGAGLAYLLGGLVIGFASRQENYITPLIGETRPWQMIFFIVGLPGIVASLLLFTVKEPVRRELKKVETANGQKTAAQVPISEFFAYFKQNKRAVLGHNFGFATLALFTYGSGAWIAEFFSRIHGWQPSRSGIIVGVLVMTLGASGIAISGWLADRLMTRGAKDAYLRVPFYTVAATIPFAIAFPLMPNPTLALIFYAPAIFLTSMLFGCAAAAIQQIMPNQMRGQASALYLFINNLIGLGLGPTVIALVTDRVFGSDKTINYSLVLVGAATLILSAILLRFAFKPYA